MGSRKRGLNVWISSINSIRIVRDYAVDIVNLKIGAASGCCRNFC